MGLHTRVRFNHITLLTLRISGRQANSIDPDQVLQNRVYPAILHTFKDSKMDVEEKYKECVPNLSNLSKISHENEILSQRAVGLSPWTLSEFALVCSVWSSIRPACPNTCSASIAQEPKIKLLLPSIISLVKSFVFTSHKPLSCWTRIYSAFANSVDPDQLASEEANWSGSAVFAIKYVNLYQQPWSSNLIGWKLEMGVAS